MTYVTRATCSSAPS